jgi:hypothetical protein
VRIFNQMSRIKFREITAPLKDYYCAYASAKNQPAQAPLKVRAASSEHAARLFDMGQGRNTELTVLVWTCEMLESKAEPFRHPLNSRGSTRLVPAPPVQRMRGFHDDAY